MNDSVRNQAVIGAFVVGAVILVVMSIIVFGSGKLFQKSSQFVMYFEGSVKGLNVGAPVTFRGVKIGRVVDITLLTNPKNMQFSIPVVIEIENDRIEKTTTFKGSTKEALERLIDKGLRARLDLQSMVTGQLLINLELLPDEPPRFTHLSHRYQEIPTVPTTFERLAKKLEALPIEEIVNNFSSSMAAFENLLNDPLLPRVIKHLDQASANLQEMSTTLNSRAVPLVDSLQRIADHTDQLVLDANAQLKPLAVSANRAAGNINTAADRISQAADAMAQLSKAAQPAIDNVERVMANVAQMTDPEARERYELRTALKALSEAARSIRDWSSYLERHPEALIYGKGEPKKR